MTVARKRLGKATLGASESTIYTVPADTEAVVSSIVVCNRDAADTTFRLAHVEGGGATGDADWVAYDAPLEGNDSGFLTVGLTMATGDELRGSGNASATVTVGVYGAEHSP